jgi:gamma-glutamyl phosphate reductase
MAKTIVLNAKMRRTGVCGAAETLLVDKAAADTQLKPLVTMLSMPVAKCAAATIFARSMHA